MRWLSFFLFLSGCAFLPSGFYQESAPLQPLPQALKDYYDYPKQAPAANMVLEKTHRKYTLRRYEFALQRPADLSIKSEKAFRQKVESLRRTEPKKARDLELRYTNRIDYFVPNGLKPGEKRPAVLISPILGGNMVVDLFAKHYVKRGMVVALVHRKRVIWQPHNEIEEIEDYLRLSLIRLRQAIDWLEVQPEVDPQRMGGFAVSYGAILHSMLSAVDDRLRYHVLAMPAAPLPETMVNCPDKAMTKLMKGIRAKYGWTEERIEEELRRVLKTDPIHLAPYMPRERMTYYVALFDRVVGAGRSWGLWRAIGKPRLRLLPFGHYGGVMVFPYLQFQSCHILKKELR